MQLRLATVLGLLDNLHFFIILFTNLHYRGQRLLKYILTELKDQWMAKKLLQH